MRRNMQGRKAALALLALLATGGASGAAELTLYTSQPNKDAQATVDAFMAAHPGIEVDWVRDGTTRIMARLRAELAGGAPQADLLLIADMVTMESLRQEGHLLPYPDAPTGGLDAGLYDPEGHYFSTKLITTGIVYNKASPVIPQSWNDLLDPALKGQIAMPSPLASGAATIHMATMTGNEAFGWGFYEDLAAQGAQPQGGNGGTFKAVAGGEKMAGIVIDYLPIREAAKGSPVAFVFPKEGVSAVTEPVAILKGTDAPEAARLFVDFLLSREGQELAAAQGYLPADPAVAPPKGFPPREEIRLMAFDPADALANDAAHKARFVSIFGE